MKDDDTARACYAGYILKALSDIENNLIQIRYWNRICPILDEKSKILIQDMRNAVEGLKKKTNNTVMEYYSAILFPDDKIDWKDGEDEYEYLKRKFEEVRRD